MRVTKHDIAKFYADLHELGLKYPVADISEATGLDKSNVSKVINGKMDPSKSFLDRFYKAFHPASMGGKKVVSRDTPPNAIIGDLSDPEKSYLLARREQKNAGKPPVRIYGGFTTLGDITVYDDGGLKHRVIGELPPDIFPGCDYGERAKGDSMYPLIVNQALLVGKICTAAGIIYGEKYIIKTKDGKDTTKFIHPGKKTGHLILKAYNKNIPDQEITADDIVFACRVHWIINPT